MLEDSANGHGPVMTENLPGLGTQKKVHNALPILGRKTASLLNVQDGFEILKSQGCLLTTSQ